MRYDPSVSNVSIQNLGCKKKTLYSILKCSDMCDEYILFRYFSKYEYERIDSSSICIKKEFLFGRKKIASYYGCSVYVRLLLFSL